MREVVEALKPVIDVLNELNVRWCVGGSVASSIYGQPRSTMDVDLVADIAADVVDQFARLLGDGYYVSTAAMQEAIARESCFNLIDYKTSFKVDIFVLKSREFDQQSITRICRDEIGGTKENLEVWVTSIEDMILYKLEWYEKGGRRSERQWQDVQAMLKTGQELDVPYLHKWANELSLTDLLKDAFAAFE